mgnify:CR=1 FL=1
MLARCAQVKDPDGGRGRRGARPRQDSPHRGQRGVLPRWPLAGSHPVQVALHSGASKAVGQLPGVGRVSVKMGAGAAPHAHAHGAQPAVPRRRRVLPRALPSSSPRSAHGGGLVRQGASGKSTVAVNLALALHQSGVSTGLVDVDVYGPDVPLMMGAKGRPGMFDNRIIPVEVHGVKIMSIGLLVDERGSPRVAWPMIHSAVQQFLRDVAWGALDYLVFDMPPGTGDAQLCSRRSSRCREWWMVTTPLRTWRPRRPQGPGHVPQAQCPHPGRVVENMSYLEAPTPGPLRHLRRGRGPAWRKSSACRCWARCRSRWRPAAAAMRVSPSWWDSRPRLRPPPSAPSRPAVTERVRSLASLQLPKLG